MMDSFTELMSACTPEAVCGLYGVLGMLLGFLIAQVFDLVLVAIGYLRDKREALKNK